MNTRHRFGLLLCLMCCSVLVSSAVADDLGRLFTSASDRARIDNLRAGLPSQQESTTNAAADRVVLNGTLRGSDGKRVVWLNGTAVNPDSANDMTLLRDGRVKLSFRDSTRTLKPGQGVDQATGEIFEYSTPAPIPAPAVAAIEPEAQTKVEATDAAAEATAKTATDAKPNTAPETKAKP